jgi:uracil-DNA glycosylase
MSLKRKAADAALADAKKVKANGSITSFFGPPKVVAKTITTTTKAVAKSADGETTETVVETSLEEEVKSSRPKFDKKKWAEKLTAEQKELLGLEIETLDESWFAVLKDELLTKEFLGLKKFLLQEHLAKKQIFPPAEEVYSWYALHHLPSQFLYQLQTYRP